MLYILGRDVDLLDTHMTGQQRITDIWVPVDERRAAPETVRSRS